ncbi:hypothetical protein FF100_33580 [Methylobacterium terricola]|uniref:Uncharacterized protein n=1 Tax=Methylobacterium terricola TaxID=2583531 RepID=A0A5C4L6U8_9HYPH|nr:hypothetical protein [Methylobacterium terricola]TNC07105.1 hypothetical protein FF100_33580 [Methylobacterium terricola]
MSRNLDAGGSAPDLAAQMEVERDRVRTLRRAIADRIEADLAILDALHGHTAPGEGDGIAAIIGESESLRLLLAAPHAGREGRA